MTGHDLIPNLIDGHDVDLDKEFGWRGTKFKYDDQTFYICDVLQSGLDDVVSCQLSLNDDHFMGPWKGFKFKFVHSVHLLM